MRKLVFAVTIICGFVFFLNRWLQTPDAAKTVELSPAARPDKVWFTRSSERALVPSVSRTEMEKASHPDVMYENPGRIDSFSSDRLSAAYNVYFSLIGQAKEQYPYAASGFDTEYNAKLARKTVLSADYSKKGAALEQEYVGLVNAISHLGHAEGAYAQTERANLVRELVARIEEGADSRIRSLEAANLIDLLDHLHHEEIPLLKLLGESTSDPMVRASLKIALGRLTEKKETL